MAFKKIIINLFTNSTNNSAYKFAIPALRTADEMHFTAVVIAFIKVVKSPVAPGTLRCSLSTNLVNDIQFQLSTNNNPAMMQNNYLDKNK
ncbi:hypothetical protein T4E_5770 [Trichinella pseudospiralis]|uniref:Uncharacterized protein n=1 Tax=Trichinella pseudospiralis TaxID=6337 RepID=A0A0V0XGU2_TRIPS|nr:hypothetical protein T4E_11937 [Trichinella pseudospiralis]KRX87250.1 hypothetical protein T4E_5770 [Trichinella pseudospiralis]